MEAKHIMQGADMFTAALLAAIAVLATPAWAGIDGSVPQSAYLTFSLLNQNPDPVAPGELLELRLKVENKGSDPASDVVLELVPGFPFSANGAERTKSLGTLSGFQKGKDAVIIRFLLTVDGSSGSGISPVALRYKASGKDWASIDNLNITIRQRDLPLGVTSAIFQPEQPVQGKPSTLKLEITNFGTSDALNLRAKINRTDSFSPSGSAGEKFIPLIRPKGRATAEFSLITLPTAKSGLATVPVLITYSDSSGRNYTLSQQFTVAVGTTPNLSASIISSDLLKAGVKREVTIEIVNKELADIKFLTATLVRAGHYEIISSEAVYLGDLDSGDSDTVSYDVFFKKPGPLLLSLEYADQFNNARQQEVEVPARIYSSSEARALGMEKNSGKGMLITVAIVVAGVFAYRMFRRRRKK